MKRAWISVLIIALMAAMVGVVSANHEEDIQCEYMLTWNSGDYNVEVGIDEIEEDGETNDDYRSGYYFRMEDDVRVTTLEPGRYLAHFNESDAGERQTFYIWAYTSESPDDYWSCETYGAFRVKYKAPDIEGWR